VADIKNAGSLAGCFMFVDYIGVLHGHGPAAEIDDFGLEGNMLFI
jgi:hypothetical protein